MKPIIIWGALALVAGLAPGAVLAEPAPIATAAKADAVETLFVWGRREGKVGVATSASEGVVSYGAFSERPLLRPGELVEVIPGLAATQHSGSGKANQYFLRGFNLDHGTDFSVAFDGVPLNLRTHAHGQGYLDLNFVIPELVETIDYRKGPYFADVGDFSAAGTASFRTFGRLTDNVVQAQVGENGYGRVLGAVNLPGDGLIAADLTTNDGPWEKGENLKKATLLGRFHVGDWAVTALAYGARWNATDQIPLRAVQSGQLSRLGAVDPTDGGRTSRFILSARRRPDADSDTILYLQRYSLTLFNNFTYFLNDPVNGDQFSQSEDRWIGGGSIARRWRLNDAFAVRAGGEFRYDAIENVGLYRTRARVRLSTDRQDAVDELSGAVWGDAEWRSGPLRASLGLRLDDIYADVASDNPLNSGSKNEVFVSPKATLAYRVSPAIELYADVGRGFHSNDVRGAVQTVAPVALTPVTPVGLFAAATGGEVGARYERRGFSASAALWALKLDSELVYSGDAGDTESTSATTRIGGEFLLNWIVRPGINVDVSYALTRARYDDAAAGGDRIPNALEYVLTAGATVRLSRDGSAQFTVRRLGPSPLNEDNSARSRPATIANLSYTHRLGPATLSLEMLNLFDSRDNDINYFYASRLPGEAPEGVEDYHFHPVEPRQLRAGVRYTF